MSPFDPVWEELGKIDYFLDNLARAVDRGVVDLSAYNRLAPAYLERRAELAAIIDTRAGVARPAAVAQQPVPTGEARVRPQPMPIPGVDEVIAASVAAGSVVEPPATESVHAASAPSPVVQRTGVPQPEPGRRPQPTSPPDRIPVGTSASEFTFEPMARTVEPRIVPWPTVLTFVGAFLVIVAAAIFAIAAWGDLGVGAKLGFLGTLTIGFYGWSELVRARLKSRSGSVALAVVAAAMLVFDGWIAIEGYGLTGPLPWAVLALVCCLVYWAMEIRIAGGAFGAVGAAAQIAWWWLLGAELGWSPLWTSAALAAIALLWDVTSRRVPRTSPAASLALVLRWAAPLLAAGTVLPALRGAATETLTLSDAFAAAVLAVALVVVLDRVPFLPKGAGAVGSVPLLAVVSMIDASALGPLALVLLIALALGYAGWELRVRGWSYAVLSVWFQLLVVLRVADTLKVSDVRTQAALAVLAFAWVAVAALLDTARAASREPTLPGIVSLRLISETAGWGMLAFVSLTVPLAVGEMPPLLGFATSIRHIGLAGLCTVAWFAGVAVRRRPWPGAFAVAGTFYTLCALMGWRAPGLDTGWYALALIALAVVWSQLRTLAVVLTRLPREALEWGMRAAAAAIPVAGFAAAGFYGTIETWATAAMFAGAGVFWIADALRDDRRLGLLIAPPVLSAAAVIATRLTLGDGLGAPVAAALMLAFAAAAWAARHRSEQLLHETGLWSLGAALGAVVAVASGGTVSGAPRELAVALFAAGLTWLAAARAGRNAEMTAVGAVVATLGILALGEAPPLLGMRTSAAHGALALAVAAVWLLAGRTERWPVASLMGFGLSFYAFAAMMARWAPGWHSAWYALGLVAFAALWYTLDGPAERFLGLPRGMTRVASVAAVVLFLLGGLAGSTYYFTIDDWPVVALLAGGAAFALLDAARSRDALGVTTAPALIVAAVSLAGAVAYRPAAGALLARSEMLAMCGALAALALASAGRWTGSRLGTRDIDSVRAWTLSAALTATLGCLFTTVPLAGGATAVGVLAGVWTVAVIVCALPGFATVPAAVGLWWACAMLDRTGAGGSIAAVWFVLYAFALAAPSFALARRGAETGHTVARALVPVGVAALVIPLFSGYAAWSGIAASAPWLSSTPGVFALVTAAAGAWLVAVSWAWSVEAGYYAGLALVLVSLLVELDAAAVTTLEYYTVPIGLYLIGMGYLFSWIGEGRRVPPGTDLAGMVVLVGIPAIQSAIGADAAASTGHAYWALGLSLTAIAAGIGLKCRTYFFGGVAALVWTAFFRSWHYLVAYWWVVLGVVGLGLLVVALTWERRQMLVADTKRALGGALDGWR